MKERVHTAQLFKVEQKWIVKGLKNLTFAIYSLIYLLSGLIFSSAIRYFSIVSYKELFLRRQQQTPSCIQAFIIRAFRHSSFMHLGIHHSCIEKFIIHALRHFHSVIHHFHAFRHSSFSSIQAFIIQAFIIFMYSDIHHFHAFGHSSFHAFSPLQALILYLWAFASYIVFFTLSGLGVGNIAPLTLAGSKSR